MFVAPNGTNSQKSSPDGKWTEWGFSSGGKRYDLKVFQGYKHKEKYVFDGAYQRRIWGERNWTELNGMEETKCQGLYEKSWFSWFERNKRTSVFFIFSPRQGAGNPPQRSKYKAGGAGHRNQHVWVIYVWELKVIIMKIIIIITLKISKSNTNINDNYKNDNNDTKRRTMMIMRIIMIIRITMRLLMIIVLMIIITFPQSS